MVYTAVLAAVLALLVAVPGVAAVAESGQDYEVIVDDGSVDPTIAVVRRHFGVLWAMGNGSVTVRGAVRMILFAENAVVEIPTNAWVKTLGNWSVDYVDPNAARYSGSGVLEVRQCRGKIAISGTGLGVKVAGCGSASIGEGLSYWTSRYHPIRRKPVIDNWLQEQFVCKVPLDSANEDALRAERAFQHIFREE